MTTKIVLSLTSPLEAGSFKAVRWETLVCHCSHEESSGESHRRPYCQPIQRLISLPVQMSRFEYPQRLGVDGNKNPKINSLHGNICVYAYNFNIKLCVHHINLLLLLLLLS